MRALTLLVAGVAVALALLADAADAQRSRRGACDYDAATRSEGARNAERQWLLDMYAATGGNDGGWLNSSGFDSAGASDERHPCCWFGVYCTPFVAGTKPNVVALSLSFNNLTGAFPSDWSALSKLEELDIAFNRLTSAVVPSRASRLPTSLRIIGLSHNPNDDEWTLPSSLASLVHLESLSAANTRLAGTLPSAATLAALRQTLVHLFLSHNPALGGTLDVLFELEFLADLSITGCAFTGTLAVLPDLFFLRRVELAHNALSGTLPDVPDMWDGTWIDLSYNDFEGSLPRTWTQFDLAFTYNIVGNPKLAGSVLPAMNRIDRRNPLAALEPQPGLCSFVDANYTTDVRRSGLAGRSAGTSIVSPFCCYEEQSGLASQHTYTYYGCMGAPPPSLTCGKDVTDNNAPRCPIAPSDILFLEPPIAPGYCTWADLAFDANQINRIKNPFYTIEILRESDSAWLNVPHPDAPVSPGDAKYDHNCLRAQCDENSPPIASPAIVDTVFAPLTAPSTSRLFRFCLNEDKAKEMDSFRGGARAEGCFEKRCEGPPFTVVKRRIAGDCNNGVVVSVGRSHSLVSAAASPWLALYPTAAAFNSQAPPNDAYGDAVVSACVNEENCGAAAQEITEITMNPSGNTLGEFASLCLYANGAPPDNTVRQSRLTLIKCELVKCNE